MLAWLFLLLPLLSAAVIHFGLKKSPTLSSYVATGSVAATLLLTLLHFGADKTISFTWASLGSESIEIGLILDKLSMGMMLVVTLIGTLVHVFSLAYMAKDEAKARYFSALSLFMFSMTGIVLSSNFIMMFMFWELVGLSSYLLIGHWYQKHSAADAAKKAFLTNRVGDFGFMIGILMVFGITGTFAFGEMSTGIASASAGVLGAAILCVFAGAMGKSAQVPLHVWLPDAMEGPTPVSALIHAATMVAAGVYMMTRFFFAITPEGASLAETVPAFSATTIAWIGGITSLLAALMATQQSDIKKVLAYSTLSQLGYMILAVGALNPEAGMFHLFTHAWFKALLFLGSASIIFACHHEQNIWKMGGLLKKMPITAWTFIIGTAALIAVPGTAGFFSKEEILASALNADGSVTPLFILVALVAFLTAFYMTRLIVITFLGTPRTKDADHAKEVGLMMWIPLAVLAVLAVLAGWKGVPTLLNALDPRGAVHHPGHYLVLGTSLLTLVFGVGAGFVLYKGKSTEPINIGLFRNRFYIDQFYDRILVGKVQSLFAGIVQFIDDFVINGLIVGGLARSSAGLGGLFRRMQSGSLQIYSLFLAFGVLAVVYITVFLR